MQSIELEERRVARKSWTFLISIVVLVVVVSSGCGAFSSSNVLQPDVVFHNGRIVTVDAEFEIVESIAIFDGRIVAVGSNETVLSLASRETRLVDLEGKTVLPGFHDNHVHLSMGTAPNPNFIDMWEAQSLDEVFIAIQDKVEELQEGEWILVDLPYTAAYPHPFPETELPTRWDLDNVAPNNPVWLRRGYYLGVLNSLALQEARVTEKTTISGGVIDRNENGELTGKLRGAMLRRLVTEVLPLFPSLDPETARGNIRRYLQGLLAMGITSANVAGVSIPVTDQWRWIQDTYDRWGEQLPRVILQPRLVPGYDRFDDIESGVATTIRELEALPFHTGFGDDRLRIGAIKMSVDGAFSGPDAWTLDAYPGQDGYHGTIRTPEEALYPVAKRAHELGWQLGFHAIGDAAIQLYVNVLERILMESPRTDARPYIHHYTMLPPVDTLEKMNQLGIIVSSHPNWIYSKMQFISEVLTGESLGRAEPLQSVLDHGLRLTFGSDGMPYSPLLAIDCAVTRIGGDGKTVYGPEERVSLEQAIRSHTIETAYMTFDDQEQGSLEVGKLADMVVLSDDIFAVPSNQIRNISIEQTIIAGQVVYTASEPHPPWQRIDHPWEWSWLTSDPVDLQ